MFCSNCGNEFTGGFCPECGTKAEPAKPAKPASKMIAPGPTNIQDNNLKNNPNIISTASKGCFEVFEYQKDLSVNPAYAQVAYFMQEMNFRKRQVLCTLNDNAIRIQAGAMQWMAGRVAMNSDVKGVGNFLGKMVKSAVTNESIAKPVYHGYGYLMMEPTYKYIILEDLSNWEGGMVLDDGMFLACDVSVREEIVKRSNVSSAVLGGEGLFNLCLSGEGVAVLESPVPRDELIEFVLDNDEVRIDGNMAVAWSKSLSFTVEKSTGSLMGSLVSGEGLVNVYRGSGKILMAPIVAGTTMSTSNSPSEGAKTSSAGLIGSVASSLLDL